MSFQSFLSIVLRFFFHCITCIKKAMGGNTFNFARNILTIRTYQHPQEIFAIGANFLKKLRNFSTSKFLLFLAFELLLERFGSNKGFIDRCGSSRLYRSDGFIAQRAVFPFASK